MTKFGAVFSLWQIICLSLFSLQDCTTNASMPPVTEGGCLASRRSVNMGTVTHASFSLLKLTVPTKPHRSTPMLDMYQTSGRMWLSRTTACTWSSLSMEPKSASVGSSRAMSSAIWPKNAKCWWSVGMHWITTTGGRWRGWGYGGRPESRGRLSGTCRAMRTLKIYLS